MPRPFSRFLFVHCGESVHMYPCAKFQVFVLWDILKGMPNIIRVTWPRPRITSGPWPSRHFVSPRRANGTAPTLIISTAYAPASPLGRPYPLGITSALTFDLPITTSLSGMSRSIRGTPALPRGNQPGLPLIAVFRRRNSSGESGLNRPELRTATVFSVDDSGGET